MSQQRQRMGEVGAGRVRQLAPGGFVVGTQRWMLFRHDELAAHVAVDVRIDEMMHVLCDAPLAVEGPGGKLLGGEAAHEVGDALGQVAELGDLLLAVDHYFFFPICVYSRPPAVQTNQRHARKIAIPATIVISKLCPRQRTGATRPLHHATPTVATPAKR